MNELVFEIAQEADGGFVAEALDESIVTPADTGDELRATFAAHRPVAQR